MCDGSVDSDVSDIDCYTHDSVPCLECALYHDLHCMMFPSGVPIDIVDIIDAYHIILRSRPSIRHRFVAYCLDIRPSKLLVCQCLKRASENAFRAIIHRRNQSNFFVTYR